MERLIGVSSNVDPIGSVDIQELFIDTNKSGVGCDLFISKMRKRAAASHSHKETHIFVGTLQTELKMMKFEFPHCEKEVNKMTTLIFEFQSVFIQTLTLHFCISWYLMPLFSTRTPVLLLHTGILAGHLTKIWYSPVEKLPTLHLRRPSILISTNTYPIAWSWTSDIALYGATGTFKVSNLTQWP